MDIRGINYDTGINFERAKLSREHWHPDAVERDIGVIASELHCNAVTVIGTDLDRLRTAAGYALAAGLRVWVQPRLINAGARASLEHLRRAAAVAEELERRAPGRITLNVGCELTLFMRGLLPGPTFEVRMLSLTVLWPVASPANRRLNRYLGDACRVAREHFSGPLTYSAGEWEHVDWTPFDRVGVDYYEDRHNTANYVTTLRGFAAAGKPVVITEFGCCTYAGAEQAGGTGFAVVNYWRSRPTVKPGHRRDEATQADQITKLVRLYAGEGIEGCFVYAFSEPTNPHDPDPRFDLDMAGYGIVKIVRPATAGEPEVWEPKAAYHALARLYQDLAG